MKKLLVLLLTGIGVSAFAQETTMPELPKNEEGKVVYQEVVEVPGVKADALYDRVYSWLDNHFNGFAAKVLNSSKTDGVIEFRDKMSRFKKVKKGKTETKMSAGYIQYNCKIDIKDGKMRYTINDIVSLEPGAPGIETYYDTTNTFYDELNWPYYLQQVKDYMDALTKGLREEAVAAPEEDKDDW